MMRAPTPTPDVVPVPAPWAVAGSVIVHCGMPAAGKSTAARAEAELARFLGLSVAVIDKDDIDTRLISAINEIAYESGPSADAWLCDPDDRDSQNYRQRVYPTVMWVLGAAVVTAVGSGHDLVVVDAPLCTEARVAADAGESLGEHLARIWGLPAGVQVRTCWHDIDAGRQRERMAERGLGRDLGKLADWEGYRARSEVQLPDETEFFGLVDAVVGPDSPNPALGPVFGISSGAGSTGYRSSGHPPRRGDNPAGFVVRSNMSASTTAATLVAVIGVLAGVTVLANRQRRR